MAKDPVVEIDLGIDRRDLSCRMQFLVAQPNAYRDQQQPDDKQSRQEKKEDDAQIWVIVGPAEDLHQPITDHGHTGGGGDRSAGNADEVVAEKQGRTHPALTESL